MDKQLRVLIVGASGLIGRAISAELSSRHEILSAGRSVAEFKLDLTDPASIEACFKKAGPLDAVICAAGEVKFAPLSDFKPLPIGKSLYTLGLENKLLGQVNLTLAARDILPEGGSITLTAGILSDTPIVSGSSASMVNGAIESFVRAAAIEMPRGIRLNCVSPTVLTEAMGTYAPFFRGFESAPARRVALAYSRSVEGRQTGQIYRLY